MQINVLFVLFAIVKSFEWAISKRKNYFARAESITQANLLLSKIKDLKIGNQFVFPFELNYTFMSAAIKLSLQCY